MSFLYMSTLLRVLCKSFPSPGKWADGLERYSLRKVRTDSSAPDGSSAQLSKALPEPIFSCSCRNHNMNTFKMWENRYHVAYMNMILIWGVLNMKTSVYSEMFCRESDLSKEILDGSFGFSHLQAEDCVCSVLSIPFPSHRRWKGDKSLKPIIGLIGPLVFFSTRLLNDVDSVNLISQTASVRRWSSVNATIKRLKRLFLGDLEQLNDEFDSKRQPNCRVCTDVITFC